MTVSRVLRNRNVHGAAIGSFPSPKATTSMDQRPTMRYLKNWTSKVGLLNLPPPSIVPSVVHAYRRDDIDCGKYEIRRMK